MEEVARSRKVSGGPRVPTHWSGQKRKNFGKGLEFHWANAAPVTTDVPPGGLAGWSASSRCHSIISKSKGPVGGHTTWHQAPNLDGQKGPPPPRNAERQTQGPRWPRPKQRIAAVPLWRPKADWPVLGQAHQSAPQKGPLEHPDICYA
ncbi:hypothetical protein NDU88_000469 [Pleurodeles waltl]|uniref:Uncharacterized protein n=1 Tax=Pleurodeles waltl TaxID=8319 RepID=A0AAV7N867_PLEWA|nr:hypothetical protein NDU88_000469 [Pleurodeles waltl]